MIYTVTLNATVDRTLVIKDLHVGGTFKASSSDLLVAGKGVNVARTAATLGEPVTALGIVGAHEEAMFASALAEMGIENGLLAVPGATRISVTILDPSSGTQTHLREQGIAPPAEALAHIEAALDATREGDWVVFSGSLPPGIPVEIYRTLVRLCRRRGARTLLDANGPALIYGVEAPPTLLKPNLFELWQLDCRRAEVTAEQDLGGVPLGDVLAAAHRVRAVGLAQIVVSLGERGVMGLDKDGLGWYARTNLDRPVVNAVGSGDALAAGLVVALARGDSFQAALRLGVACGAANTLVAGAGRCAVSDVERLARRAVVEQLVSSFHDTDVLCYNSRREPW
jgi:1-phosphofructokinase family hexose kinase